MKQKFQTPGETYQDREQYWIERIVEARSYPGGVMKYCRDNGITKEIYYHWFHKVKDKVESWQVPLDTNVKRRKKPPRIPKGTSRSARPRSEWASLVKDCQRAGMRPTEFARENNLEKVTFCRWYRRLAGESPACRNDVKRTVAADAKSIFVPVKIAEPEEEVEKDEFPRHAAIQIALGNGRIVHVHEGCAAALLKMVVLTLEDC
jgi:hypothetical protein